MSRRPRSRIWFLLKVLLPVALLAGGAAWWIRHMKPRWTPAAPPATAAVPAPKPARDPLQGPFEEAGRDVGAGRLAAARELLLKALGAPPPGSALVPRMRALLGELNVTLFLNDPTDTRRDSHTVGPGDTLVGVARRFGCTPEMLALLNDLPGITIRKGQRMSVPKGRFSLAIDPAAREVFLLSDGYFFNAYPIVEYRLPPTHKGAFHSTVSKKFNWKAGAQVAFGHPAHLDAARWITLATPGYILFTRQEDPGWDVAPPPTGFALQPGDLDEISIFLVPGAEATVQN